MAECVVWSKENKLDFVGLGRPQEYFASYQKINELFEFHQKYVLFVFSELQFSLCAIHRNFLN